MFIVLAGCGFLKLTSFPGNSWSALTPENIPENIPENVLENILENVLETTLLSIFSLERYSSV